MNLPKKVSIEACTICQLNCPSCSNGIGKLQNGFVGKGFLTFENFRRFVNKNPFVEKVELSSWGEIFLNPELDKIISFAFEQGIKLTANNGVNLNSVSDKVLELLVKCKFKSLLVSLDGVSNETYSFYRRGGNFEVVINNIKKINHFKEKYNSEFPKLYWQFVIMGHNEHELPKARGLAKDLGMVFKPKFSWDSTFSPIRDKEFVKRESGLGVTTRKEYEKETNTSYCMPCVQLWKNPQINWDGKLLGCCVNRIKDFGVNVFEVGLKKALKNKKFVYAKQMLLDKKEPHLDIPCALCPQYLAFIVSDKRGLDLE